MNSKILLGAVYYLLPILLIFSLFSLFRGHYEPGGGFVGGLTAASGFALYILSHGRKSTKQILPGSSSLVSLIGVTFILIAGIIGFFFGDGFLAAKWIDVEIATLGKPGTPILFDLGIYLVVVGTLTKVVLTLTDE